ncbi:sulfotransferase [Sphingomonas sp. MMS24-J45]|uniref:sulfotransferase n=1 Tax=Sphingomonas sp. MMS24-J45 TaxID=3238806 RepID=UPI00384FF01C
MISPERPPLDIFRAMVSADCALEQQLGAIAEMREFVAVAAAAADARGLLLDPATLERAASPDPLGIDRFLPKPITGEAAPGPAWLPMAVVDLPDGPAVDWFYLGNRTLSEPFFEDSIRRGRSLPISRLMQHRTPLAALPEAFGAEGVVPDGLIFHLSRCGSTLVAQMLAALPDTVVASEPPPFDHVLQRVAQANDQPIAQRIALIRAMAAALGRQTTPGGSFVIKTDCWHTNALPLLAAAFPETPWIFLYRDPVDIMVSQVRQRGFQTIPGGIGASVFGISSDGLSPEEYCAYLLERTCAPVIEASDRSRGLLINYAQLPDALEHSILPHFGIALDAPGREALAAAALRDAKAPYQSFTPDTEEKRREASPAVRAAVERYVAVPYQRLEMLRTGG